VSEDPNSCDLELILEDRRHPTIWILFDSCMNCGKLPKHIKLIFGTVNYLAHFRKGSGYLKKGFLALKPHPNSGLCCIWLLHHTNTLSTNSETVIVVDDTNASTPARPFYQMCLALLKQCFQIYVRSSTRTYYLHIKHTLITITSTKVSTSSLGVFVFSG